MKRARHRITKNQSQLEATSEKKPFVDLRQIQLITIALLLIAVFPISEYGYYMFLRVTVFSVALYTLYKAKSNNLTSDLEGYLILVLLFFNPIIPVHLTKVIWILINLATAFLFYKITKEKNES